MFRSQMTMTIETLGSRARTWARAVRNMERSSYVSTTVRNNRAFMRQLRLVNSQSDYIELINDFGQVYLMNMRQLEEVLKNANFANEAKLKKIVRKMLSDLKKL